jgi:hypothetical protein
MPEIGRLFGDAPPLCSKISTQVVPPGALSSGRAAFAAAMSGRKFCIRSSRGDGAIACAVCDRRSAESPEIRSIACTVGGSSLPPELEPPGLSMFKEEVRRYFVH